MTGSINLLEKLPHAADAAADKKRAVAKYLLVAAASANLGACVATGSLMRIIGPHDFLAVVVYECFGFIVAGPVACIACSTLFASKWSVRLAALCTSLAFVLAALAIGTVLSDGRNYVFFSASRVLPAVPLVVLGVALPFIFARYLISWQIVFPQLHERPVRQTITVSGLLLSTAIAAICIALVRTSDEPVGAIILAMALGGLGLFLLPMTYFLMRSVHYWRYFAIFCVIAFFVGSLSASYVCFVYGSINDLWSYIGFGISALAGVAVFGVTIISCRLMGGILFKSGDFIPAVKGYVLDPNSRDSA